MASLFADLVTYLKTKANITALVGVGANAQIYDDQIKEGAKPPFIRIEIFEGEAHNHLGGEVGMSDNRFQVDCYGKTRAVAYQLADAVRLDQSGSGASFGFKNHFTLGARYANSIESAGSYQYGSDPPASGQHTPRYWVSRDYFIDHQEPTS